MPRHVQVGLKLLAIFVLGYLFLLIGNSMGALLVSGLDPRAVGVIGALLGGLAAGCLTALMFRRYGILLSPVLAMLPVTISWFARGARVTRITYVYRNDELIPVSGQQPEVVQAALITMLILAAVAGLLGYGICYLRKDRGRD